MPPGVASIVLSVLVLVLLPGTGYACADDAAEHPPEHPAGRSSERPSEDAATEKAAARTKEELAEAEEAGEARYTWYEDGGTWKRKQK